MGSVEREMSDASKRDSEEDDKPTVSTRDNNENELNVSNTDVLGDEWCCPGRRGEEDELSALEREKGEDEGNALQRDEGEDDHCLMRSKGGDESTVWKTDEKEDEKNALQRDEKEDEQSALGREEREDEKNMLRRHEKDDDTSLSTSSKEEDGPGVLTNTDEEGEPSTPERNAQEDEPSTLENDAKEEEPNSLKNNTKEDGRNIQESSIREDAQNAPKASATQDETSARKMETKEQAQVQEDQLSSTYGMLQHISEEAVRVAGAFQNMYFAGPINPQSPSPGHRRAQSEIGTSGHRRANSFQRLKMQMQKAWRGVSNLREDSRPSFNPEILANQKRQWYQLHSSKAMDQTKYNDPTSLFEHFIIVGLHPETNLEVVEAAFAKRKKWEMEMGSSEEFDFRILQHRGPQLPILEPQILFKYPPGKKLAMRANDLAAFCFPGGVKARIIERTPSLSDLNELVYGQEHLGRDDSAFIFSLKVADDATLYGVCLHVPEIVQRPPGILSASSPLHSSGGGSRFLVSAARCYCLLTRVPFFELHFELLNSMIAQERLKRITEFVSEMSIASADSSPTKSRPDGQIDGNLGSPRGENLNEWMAFAIPVDSAMALTAAAAGFISDDEIHSSSLKTLEPQSPDSVAASDASDASHAKETDRDGRKSSQYIDDNASGASETPERMCGSYDSVQVSPEIGTFNSYRSFTLERLPSSESLFSSARSMVSDEVVDGHLSNSESDFGDELIMEWAREHKNDLLRIICSYHSKALPPRGSAIVFQPLEHLQAIEYLRAPVYALGLSEEYLDSCDACEVNARLAAAEEALALSIWTTATLCRALSLESVLALLAGVLLEKQVVVVCPNLGVLSAILLSLVPMIRPFQWQSLLLPVLPGRMFDFLDAPVPYLVGIQSKPADLKIKTSNLVQVNVLADQVKSCQLPSLPRHRELIAQLSPIHARLAYQNSVARRHPVYRCSEVQAEAASRFLQVMRHYLESLCSDLRSHTITSVQSNNDRVSLLLKDSFIDSFPSRDRSFIKLLVDTQQFSVLSDSRLSSFEHGCL